MSFALVCDRIFGFRVSVSTLRAMEFVCRTRSTVTVTTISVNTSHRSDGLREVTTYTLPPDKISGSKPPCHAAQRDGMSLPLSLSSYVTLEPNHFPKSRTPSSRREALIQIPHASISQALNLEEPCLPCASVSVESSKFLL